MTTRPDRRRIVGVALTATAAAGASAFLAFGPAFGATPLPAPAAPSAGHPAPIPAITDPAVSGTDLVVWTGPASIPLQIQVQRENQGKHDTSKNTIQNVR